MLVSSCARFLLREAHMVAAMHFCVLIAFLVHVLKEGHTSIIMYLNEIQMFNKKVIEN